MDRAGLIKILAFAQLTIFSQQETWNKMTFMWWEPLVGSTKMFPSIPFFLISSRLFYSFWNLFKSETKRNLTCLLICNIGGCCWL